MNNNEEMKNGFEQEKKRPFQEFFSSEKVLFVLSVLMSFAIWIFVTASSGETANYTISNIPVNMDLSDDAVADGLTVVSINGISVENFTAAVKVSGNSVTVGSLTTSDIVISGTNLGNIVTSGTYNVTLSAKPQGLKSNYSIVSLSPSEVTIVVDRTIEKEIEIESRIIASAPAEYYMGSPTFSSKTVVIRGPEQSVSKVGAAVVSKTIEKEITTTTTIENLTVSLLDSDGNIIEDDSLIIEPATVDATIPILTKKTVPIELLCENKPEGLSLNEFVTIEPSEIEIAASSDIIDNINSISIGTVDFNKLNYGTTERKFEVIMPEGVRNLNNVESANVSFHFIGYTSNQFTITNFTMVNVPDGLEAKYSPYSKLVVRVIGPDNEIADLKASDVEAIIDLSNAQTGTFDMPVRFELSGVESCWCYNIDFFVNVTVSEISKSSDTNIVVTD